jgi:hypothetical protein
MTPRPTMWNGVLMRSRLEAGFAEWAASWGLDPKYEPHAFAGGDDGGQYLPDFLLSCVDVEGQPTPTTYDDGLVWVEVKPYLSTGAELVALKARMEIIRASDPRAVLAIVYKDPRPGVLARGRFGWRPAVWTHGDHGYCNIGLAFPLLEPGDDPWPDGYWKGPEA